jgi:alcohol dehydrogenase
MISLMIKDFLLDLPRSIIFGPGKRKEIPALLKVYGNSVLLVTGQRWFKLSRFSSEFSAMLKGFKIEHLCCPAGEPTSCGVEELLAAARNFNPHIILAVGGGSVLDTAKTISGLLPLKDRVVDFLEGVGRGLTIPGPGVPWIAMPTTSGTGAEATCNAVIRSVESSAKKSIRSSYLLAGQVVVDPELTLECPREVSGMAGLDALTQLIEAYVSRKATVVPRALVRDALPVMLDSLLKIANNPANLEARSGAAYGSLISGLALANSGLGAAHGFASALGGMAAIPHGLICAIFLIPVLKVNAELINSDLELLLRPAGYTQKDNGGAVEWLAAKVEKLLDAFNLPLTLSGYNLDRGLIPEMAHRSSGSSMSGNPRELSREEREEIISRMI